ncbi:MAG: hypothetical protein JO112_17425, partial [Planctomycetes bacterium]|nr:hypothetical protein [Planctomycetota bacterium]
REKTVPLPEGSVVQTALMGCNGPGPLLLLSDGRYVPWDVDRMQPADLAKNDLNADPHWPFEGRIAADGQAVVLWTAGLSGQNYKLVRLRREKNLVAVSPDSHSFNGHWAMPNPDASLVFRYGAGIYNGNLLPIASDSFKGMVLLPTEDPRFFLAVREETGTTNQVLICTSTDRQVVWTVTGVEKMTGSSLNSNWGIFGTEPRVHYLPSAGVLVNLPESNDRVVVRPLNLAEALQQSGQDFLVVLSRPDSPVQPGTTFTYRMEVRSKAGGLHYTLEAGPEGMTVSDAGVVRWQVPDHLESQTARVIITVRSSSGKEMQHAFDLTVGVPPAKSP